MYHLGRCFAARHRCPQRLGLMLLWWRLFCAQGREGEEGQSRPRSVWVGVHCYLPRQGAAAVPSGGEGGCMRGYSSSRAAAAGGWPPSARWGCEWPRFDGQRRFTHACGITDK